MTNDIILWRRHCKGKSNFWNVTFVPKVFNHFVASRRASGSNISRDCRNLLPSSLPECNDTSIEVIEHVTVEIGHSLLYPSVMMQVWKLLSTWELKSATTTAPVRVQSNGTYFSTVCRSQTGGWRAVSWFYYRRQYVTWRDATGLNMHIPSYDMVISLAQ